MIELEVFENSDYCSGCGGSCCMEMTNPPDYFMPLQYLQGIESQPGEAEGFISRLSQKNPAELQRLKSIPEDLRLAIFERAEVHCRDDIPCLWLDLKTRKCKHYDLRPSICRSYEPCDENCADRYGKFQSNETVEWSDEDW